VSCDALYRLLNIVQSLIKPFVSQPFQNNETMTKFTPFFSQNLTIMKRLLAFGVAFVLASSATFAQGNLQKAKELLAAKEYQSALPAAVAAVKDNPRDLPSLLLLGDVYDAIDQQDSALAYYQKAQDVDYWKPEVMRKVALGLSAVGKHGDALKKAEELTKTHAKDAESFLVLSQVYIAGNESPEFVKAKVENPLTKADAAVIKAQSINKSAASFVARGDLYFAQRVFELAQNNYEEALKLDPNLTESRAKLAEAYFRIANNTGTSKEDNINFVNKSLKEWDLVTKADTNNVKAFFSKGKIQFLAKKYAEAVPTLQRYLILKPDGVQGRWFLAQAAFSLLENEKKEYDTNLVSHLTMSKKAIDTIADKADLMIAKTLLYKRDFKGSADKFAEIKANKGLQPADIELYARAAINGGDTATAVREYKDFFVKNPKSCKLMMSIGTALYQWRQYDDAIETFRKRLNPENCPADSLSARANYYIGAAYFSKNKLDSALPALQESVKLDPKALYARQQLATTFLEMKKVKEAKDEYVKIVEMGKADTVKGKRDVTQALSTLCRIANGQKNWGELKKNALDWAAVDPDNTFGWFYAAIASQQAQNTADACKYYQEALKRARASKNPNEQKMAGDFETQLEALACAGASAPAGGGAKGGKKKK
jgi:tetratricopeptide (TPR) repeat protein